MEPSAKRFGSSTRTRPRKPERLRNLGNLGKTLVEPWWDLPQNLLAAQHGYAQKPERLRNLCNLGETLVEPWWNLLQNLLAAQHASAPENERLRNFLVKLWWDLGETFHRTFWQLNVHLPPKKTRETTKLGQSC